MAVMLSFDIVSQDSEIWCIWMINDLNNDQSAHSINIIVTIECDYMKKCYGLL